MSIYQDWIDAKAAEKAAIDRRREIEDQLVEELDLDPAHEGTLNFDFDQYKVKIVTRLNESVNSDLLQELAQEAGIYEHLSTLFRWKPEINKKAWKDADPAITAALADAITIKSSRPTFTIMQEEEKS